MMNRSRLKMLGLGVLLAAGASAIITSFSTRQNTPASSMASVSNFDPGVAHPVKTRLTLNCFMRNRNAAA